VDRICLAQVMYKWRDLVNTAMNHRDLENAWQVSCGYTTGSLSSELLGR
jgi:hypothetical protein